MLATCAEVAGTRPEMVWLDETFLGSQGVMYPMPPYWPAFMAADGFMRASPARAVAAGLRNRSLAQTVADTLAWDRTRDWSEPMAGGAPTLERERELLAAWAAR